MTKNTKKGWGFTSTDMDTRVRPQDDFYRYAGGGWMKRNAIPTEEARWGSFMLLRRQTDDQLHAIIKELVAKKRTESGSPEQLVGDFFKSGMDEKRRTDLGTKPLQPLVQSIRRIRNAQDLVDVIAALHRIGIDAAWACGIDQDAKNSERYALHFMQSGLGMPDREYYLDDTPEARRVRAAYLKHLSALLRLAGRTKAEAARETATIMRFETQLAEHSMDKVSCRDIDQTYHKMSTRQFAKLAPHLDWDRYLTKIGAPRAVNPIVMQPQFFAQLSAMVASVPLDTWKTYLEWEVLNSFASLLSPAFGKQSFSFYGTVLSGTRKMKPAWRRVLGVVNGSLGELVGKLYVERHFSPTAKAKIRALVNDLFDAYEARIKALDWMTPATKKKAVRKLRAMTHKIGYPDRWKSYRGLVIQHDDYVGNVLRAAAYEHRRAMRKLGRPIDRAEWFMYPQTVNAYFAGSLNDIVFPAAILQPPFFDERADDAVNYGSIGAVIGHEMTHGFDDQGSKLDAHGNLRPWWTKEDRANFEAKTKVLVQQFNAYTVADGVRVNGELTLGENVADLGGAAIALNAYRSYLAKHPEQDIVLDGFTPTQRFFLGLSLFERELSRPEFVKTLVLNDPHAPGEFRVNGPVSNMTEFYEAFNVKKGDRLYRAPESRAKIW